jgi:hypothetical protein
MYCSCLGLGRKVHYLTTHDGSEYMIPTTRSAALRVFLALSTLFALLPKMNAGAQPPTPLQQPSPVDWHLVEQALGRAGQMQPGDVIKFGFPRRDLHVLIGGVLLRPSFALGSWVAFKETNPGHSMAMGDLVVTEAEVDRVIERLQQGGVELTALHNHLLNESPHVMYMHIRGSGDAVVIARAIHSALALTGTPMDTASSGTKQPAFELDTAELTRILGRSGRINGGVYQVSVARAEPIMDNGDGNPPMAHEIPPSMGVATAINFQPTGKNRAAITGDFVMTANEVNPVIRALRPNGIQVTGLHSHMLTEQPRLFFMHFWANDDAASLARGLRAALDQMNVKK